MEQSNEEPKKKPRLIAWRDKLMQKNKYSFPILVGVTIILTLAILYVIVVGVGLYGFHWRYNFVKTTAEIVPYPAGWVNVFPIRFGEVFAEEAPAKKFYQQTGSAVPSEATLESQAMDFLVRVKVVQEYAGLYKVSVPVSDVKSSLNTLYQQNGGQQSFEQILNQYYGYTPKDIYNLVYLSLMQQKLNDYYDQNIAKQVQLSEVLLSDQTKANSILASAKKGTDFATLVKDNSLDATSKVKGGDLGFFSADTASQVITKGTTLDQNLNTQFQNDIWNAKVGDVFLLKTDLGYQVIKVTGFKGTETSTFDNWLQNKIDKGFVLRFN